MDTTIYELEPIHDLPQALSKEIGRVIVGFARLDWQISHILYRAMGVSSAFGRIAIKDQPLTEKFESIRQITELSGLHVKADLIELRKAIKACQQQRNDLAHGVWVNSPSGQLHLCYAKGERDSDAPEILPRSRKLLPESVPYSIENARSLVALIDRTITAVREWARELSTLEASK